MLFFAFHGLYPEENKAGNKFKVQLKVIASDIFDNDDINTTVDYVLLYDIVQEEMQIQRKLLETVAVSILKRIGQKMKLVKEAEVTIHKLNPPLSGIVGSSSITMNSHYY